jgi:hypothetical protein
MRRADAPQDPLTRPFRGETLMHRLFNLTGLTLTMLSLAWAAPSFAQQPSETMDLVPFQASYTVSSQLITVPVSPPIVAQPGTITGQSDMQGPFTGVALANIQLGVDGTRLFNNVEGLWTNANGDTLSVHLTNLFPAQTAPGTPVFQGASIIKNGTGRFQGASGSGFSKGTLDPKTGVVTVSLDGMITRPK